MQVCSNRMQKSVVVMVELRRWVNKYRMWHTFLRKYMAHDSSDTCNIGDVVKIEQLSQRLSTRKAFNVVQIVQREKIVLDEDLTHLPGAVANFAERPSWAGLTPATADALRTVRHQYEQYYSVSPDAREIAGKAALPATTSIEEPQERRVPPGPASAPPAAGPASAPPAASPAASPPSGPAASPPTPQYEPWPGTAPPTATPAS
jgi:small subunit ribosomal protein S17